MRFDRGSLHSVVLSVAAAVALGLMTACGGGAAAPTSTPAASTPAGAAPAPSPPRPALASPVASPSATVSTSSAPNPTATAETTSAAESYEVQSGDTLATIAQQFYGDPTQWRRIYDANKDAIGADPDKLKLGTKLSIPPKQS